MTTQHSEVQAKTRLAVLDGVRATSILLVLGAHMLPLGPKLLQLNSAAGLAGMSLFFTLSGFLIASFLLEKQDITEFVAKRFTRIVPAAYLYIVIMFVLVQWRPDTALASALFFINYADAAMTDGSGHLWSLCVEMQFYAVAAIIVGLFGKRGLLILPLLALAVTAGRIANGEIATIRTHARVDEILAGSTLALIRAGALPGWSRIRPWLERGFWPFLAFWVLCCLVQTGPLGYLRPYTAALFVAAIIVHRRDWIVDVLESKPLGYIATISYPLYIWHAGFLMAWFSEGSTLERYLVKRPISFALSFAAAHVSTFYVEKPISKGVRALLARRRKRIEAAARAPARQ